MSIPAPNSITTRLLGFFVQIVLAVCWLSVRELIHTQSLNIRIFGLASLRVVEHVFSSGGQIDHDVILADGIATAGGGIDAEGGG